ncbi:MAG TPA: NAD(P)/FAD-dependent oxidoreductase [Streptosporangiaceae bacterium]
MTEPKPLDALVVGAGFAGLYQLYKLHEHGLSCRAIEAGEDLGGTWYWNRYPGARCDIQSLSYSYSFSPDLEQEWEWTEKYPAQPEILRYLNHVAERFGLREDITFGTRVASAHYQDSAATWIVTTDRGESIEARFLIMATGCLSVPKQPEFPGLASYQGRTHMTARWGEEDVRFDGLRVGVIGTGSSGVQCIPVIAAQAAELTVFQRTPAFCMPAFNRPLGATEMAEMKANYPAWREAQRISNLGVPHEQATESAMAVPEGERTAAYERGWAAGDLYSILGSYTDLLVDPAANDTAAEFIRAKIRAVVSEPELAEALSPRSYPFGTKRPCLDAGYYETFNRPNVHLVDLRATPLAGFTQAGVRTIAASYELDAVVFATGFDAMTGALAAIDVTGRNGVDLSSRWADGPRNYLGLAMAGFPNLFTITGPLSPSVISNMVVSIEQHVEWITDCIADLRRAGYTSIEPMVQAEDEWVRLVADVGALTLFPASDSWYTGANVPGKPRVLLPYLGGVGEYRSRCEEVASAGYRGFTLTRAGRVAAA